MFCVSVTFVQKQEDRPLFLFVNARELASPMCIFGGEVIALSVQVFVFAGQAVKECVCV